MKKTAFLFLVLISSAAFAKPPMVEFFLTVYNGKNCIERAEYALKKSGFKSKGGTFSGEDRVGFQNDYKGAVGCSSEALTSVVFVVAGPSYPKAKKLARLLQKNFMAY